MDTFFDFSFLYSPALSLFHHPLLLFYILEQKTIQRVSTSPGHDSMRVRGVDTYFFEVSTVHPICTPILTGRVGQTPIRVRMA